jgi:hypothetical protein
MQAGACPTPFGEWLESQRKQIAATNPEAAARFAGVHDPAGFRELLLGPDGNAIMAILIGAKAPVPGDGADGLAWD